MSPEKAGLEQRLMGCAPHFTTVVCPLQNERLNRPSRHTAVVLITDIDIDVKVEHWRCAETAFGIHVVLFDGVTYGAIIVAQALIAYL